MASGNVTVVRSLRSPQEAATHKAKPPTPQKGWGTRKGTKTKPQVSRLCEAAKAPDVHDFRRVKRRDDLSYKARDGNYANTVTRRARLSPQCTRSKRG